jgi:hypothetical protein
LKAEFVSLIRSQGAFYCCGAQFLLLCTAAKPIDLFMEEASKIGGRVLNASFSNPFIPKLWTVLHKDYGKAELRGDVAAGLTVAVVALPLSMAIAIASGVTPDRGLYTAILGGFIVSAFGGRLCRNPRAEPSTVSE